MSIHHMERAAGLEMPATRKLIFMALCDDADRETGVAYPGMEKLLTWAGCGKSQAHEHLAALIEDGYVERVEAGRRGHRATYRVFAAVACCSEHQPVLSGQPDPISVDTAGKGPDSVRIASGKGPDSVRSGPDPSLNSPTPQLPVTPNGVTARPSDGEFDRFWATYPRRVGKGQAVRAWKTATKKADPSTIITAAAGFAAWCGQDGTDPQFIPHPSTWLNGERWLDERRPSEAQPPPAKSRQQAATDDLFAGAMQRAQAKELPA